MINIIDNSDHFQHSNRSISKLNFLKFWAAAWSAICALTDQQNRLHHYDYRRIFSASALGIVYEVGCVDQGALIALDGLSIE